LWSRTRHRKLLKLVLITHSRHSKLSNRES
jgi:hypothetical protein